MGKENGAGDEKDQKKGTRDKVAGDGERGTRGNGLTGGGRRTKNILY